MKLSAIILSKGEDTTQKTVNSVDFADEVIIVLDDNAETKLKGSSKVRIVKHELVGDYSQQRNFAATQAKGDWLLYIDSDETISTDLQKEIVSVVSGQWSAVSSNSYYLRRRDYFWGKELRFGETKTARETGFVRLVKKNSGSWQRTVHEKFVSEHTPSTLKGFIDHYPHQSISEFLLSVNEYSSLRAKELKNNGEHFSTLKMIFYPMGKFIHTYFFKLGFLDGAAGFTYSFMMSFHSFLVRTKLLNL